MTNPQQQGSFDPFEQGDGVPAVSFKDAPLNSMVTIVVDDDAKWLQSRDFETGELAYWDARPGEAPNPKMSAVVTGAVQDTPWARQLGIVGERRSFWAQKPSSLFSAIQTAKRNVGQGTQILPGGRLDVAFVGEEPNKKNPNLNGIKQYAARYTPPPAGFGVADPFADQQQAAQQQPAAPAPQQPPAQQYAQGGPVGPVAQQHYAAAPAQYPVAAQAPAGNPFGQAPAQQPVAQPQGNPFGQVSAPAQQPQPAMAAAPAGSDPWSTAPSSDVPNF